MKQNKFDNSLLKLTKKQKIKREEMVARINQQKIDREKSLDASFEMSDENLKQLKRSEQKYLKAIQSMYMYQSIIQKELIARQQQVLGLPNIDIYLIPSDEPDESGKDEIKITANDMDIFRAVFNVEGLLLPHCSACCLALFMERGEENKWKSHLHSPEVQTIGNEYFSKDFVTLKEYYHASWKDMLMVRRFLIYIECGYYHDSEE
jgi:hypothetical protein